MPYHIEYSKISVLEYKEKLIKIDLVPSRRLLKDNIDSIFDTIIKQDIANVDHLLKCIKSKKRLLEFAFQTGISESYLTILSREIRSNIPKAERLRDFKSIDPSTIEKLKAFGFKNTKQFWEAGILSIDRKEMSNSLEIKKEEIDRIIQLCDLSRVRWVNHTFAEILMMAMINSVADLQSADAVDLHSKVLVLNEKHVWYKGKIGLNDFKLVIHAAKELSIDMEF